MRLQPPCSLRFSLSCAAALLVAVGGPSAAEAQIGPEAEAAIDEAFADIEAQAPGCAAGIVEAGDLVWAKGYGAANLDYGIPVTPRTNFYLGSVGKQFTAAAVLHAANAGHLSLDDPIQTWFPEIPEYERPVTVEHLIHHTSGLRDYLGLMSLAGQDYGDVVSKAQIVEMIARQEDTNFPPGDHYLYSNTGYFLLAEIVERASGLSLREYLETHFFGPLEMERTVVYDDRREIMPDRAVGYSRAGDEWVMNHAWNFDQVGSGGVWGSIEDLARWDRNYYTEEVGGPGFTAQLLERFTLTDGTTIPYAFVLSHGEHRGLTTVGHGGALAGFRTDLLRFPEQRTTFLATCNFASSNPGQRTRAMADAVLSDFLEPIPEETQEEVNLSSEQLDAFLGTWRTEGGTEVEIVREGPGLVFVQDGQRMPVTVHSENEISIGDGAIRMTTANRVEGRWTEMSVEQGGQTFPALRPGADFEVPDLSGYVGTWYSPELDAHYRMTMEEDALRLHMPNGNTLPVVSAGERGLRAPLGMLAPVREDGEITALILDAGRVQGIRFERIDEGN